MAQIKKLQPGGTTPEKTTPKYGRLIQNGIEIQANDDMINWLAQQGYYGEQMANNLRNGDDQYLDTDEQGVGWIRNISVENPELKEKQQERTTRASRRLEGRRLNQARTDIQRLATYDYSKFVEKPKAKTPYKWDTLVIDYNTKEDGTKEFSNNQVNFDIIKRLGDLKNGLVIPEDQEFKDYDRVTQHYNNVKDLLEGTITRMRAGKLTADDEDILAGLGIYVTSPKTSSGSTSSTPENENLEYVIKTQMGISDKELANKMASEFTVGVNGRLIPKKVLSDRFGNNYWFSEHDLDGYNKYAGYALLNGELVKVGSQPWKNWMDSAQGKSFVENYNLGAWNEAAKSMGFYGSNTEWNEYNPKTHYSSYFQPFTKYLDISGYYNLDGYLGVYDVLSDIGENGLVTRKRIAIKNDGTIEDATAWNRVTATPQSYTTSAIHALQAIPNMDNTNGIPLTDDGRYWLVIDADGTKHVYQKNRVNNKYSEVTNLGDISKLSVGAIKDLVAQKVTGTWARAKRMQVGGVVLPATTPTQKIATPISDSTKPYSTKDVVNGVMPNLSDAADLLSLGLDIGGLISGEIPGVGEGLGYASDVASFVGDISRDGFQWGDVGNLVTNAGLTTVGLVPVIGSGTGVAKVLKGVKKLEPVLRGGFTAFGLYQGIDSLDNILSGDFTTEDLRHLLNGIMAVRGIYKNRKGYDLMDKYGESKTKTKTDVEVDGESLLKGLPKEKQLEIKKKAVDAAIKADDSITTFEGNKVDWVDDSGKVIDYEKAWKGLRENGHITDKMLKENRSWFEGVKNEAGKAKSVVSEKVESGWEWLKRQIVPVDASQYRMRSDLTDDEIKALVNEGPIKGSKYIELLNKQSAEDWTIPSNKKGGKIKKCGGGDNLLIDQLSYLPKMKFDTNENLVAPQPTKVRSIADTIMDKILYSQATPAKSPEQINFNNAVDHHRLTRDDNGKIVFAEYNTAANNDINKPLPWQQFKPITSVPEFKPSGTIPEKKGPLDKALEESRKNFQEGLERMSQTKEQQTQTQQARKWAQDKVTSVFSGVDKQENGGWDVAGSGKEKDWSSIKESLVGNGARAAAYLTPHFTNKGVLGHALDAIRSKYLGAMKSMPIQQPLQRYNITPMTSLFDKQRTEFRNASRQIAKNFADSKLQVAQFLATEDQIAKREDNLLNQISKHITEVDLANTQLRNMHAKDEQAIADYNSNLRGQQKAEESMALAQHAQKQGDNFNRSLAEFRTDWNKYLAQKDQMDLYENYQDVFNKYRAETDPTKKADYAEQIGLLSYLIKQGGSTRNPITYGRS